MNLRAFFYITHRFKNILIVFFVIFECSDISAQSVRVTERKIPYEIKFGDVTFQLNEVSRYLMSQEVAAINKDAELKKEYLFKLSLYLPLIEPIIKASGVSNDFKYLSIYNKYQKTSSISTFLEPGVFWCMDMTKAQDVDLRVNKEVDERKHLVLSTKAAVICLKRNQVLYDNWGSTLFAHLASREVLNMLEINKKWKSKYILLDSPAYSSLIQFLAFKWVLESDFNSFKVENPKIIYEYHYGKGKTLNLIAADLKLDPKELLNNNFWLKTNRVPEGEASVIVVVDASKYHEVRWLADLSKNLNIGKLEPVGFPVVVENPKFNFGKGGVFYKINNLKGIQADMCDSYVTLAYKSKLNISKFLEINDMNDKDVVNIGQIYYIESKQSKGPIPHHIVSNEETLWEISQKYGVQLKSLLKYNRMETIGRLQEGRVIWLQQKRPKKKPIEFIEHIIEEAPETEFKNRFDDELFENALVRESKEISKFQEEDTEDNLEVLEVKLLPNQPSELIIPSEKNVSKPKEEKKTVVEVKNITELPEKVVRKKVEVKIDEEKPESIFKKEKEFNKTNTNKEFLVHEVKKGETLYRISVNYKVSVEQLYKLNNLKNNTIEIGDKIIVKKY